MQSGKPELIYFDVYAKGECIGMILKHAKVDFTDTRCNREMLNKLIEEGKTAAQVPIYNDGKSDRWYN